MWPCERARLFPGVRRSRLVLSLTPSPVRGVVCGVVWCGCVWCVVCRPRADSWQVAEIRGMTGQTHGMHEAEGMQELAKGMAMLGGMVGAGISGMANAFSAPAPTVRTAPPIP